MDCTDLQDPLFQIADAIGFVAGAIDGLASRRATLERYVAAGLAASPLNVPPEDAARLAWTRSLAALRWADDHAAEVEAAARLAEQRVK